MRKLIPLLVILLSPLATLAQGSRYDNIALGVRGPVPFASVAVCTQPAITTTQPCSPLATLYTDSTVTTTAPNPLTADALGNYHFYAKTGKYTIQIYSPQISPAFVMTDQDLACDPTACVIQAIYLANLVNGQCTQGATAMSLVELVPTGSACGGGSGGIGGSTTAGQVAVGASGNNLQSYANLTFDGSTLFLNQINLASSGIVSGVQGAGDARLQLAPSGLTTSAGQPSCYDANGGLTNVGCTGSSAVLSVTRKVLPSNVSLAPSTVTTIDSQAITMPSAGCPCRVQINYTYFWGISSGSAPNNINAYVAVTTSPTDSTLYAPSQAGLTTSNSTVSDVKGDDITEDYSNGQNVTFTVKAEGTPSLSVNAHGGVLSSLTSQLVLTVVTSQ